MNNKNLIHKTPLPRLIRLRDAPYYLGMNKNLFNADVRPFLTELPIGIQGIAFDRLDLDDFADEYIRCNGRPPERKLWDVKNRQGSSNVEGSGTSTSRFEENEFAKALELATLKQPKNI